MRGFSKTQVVGFFFTGAAVGAAVALVLAPKAGTQVRKDIRRFSKKTVNQLDDIQNDIRDQITGGYGQVMEALDSMKDYVEDGKSWLKKVTKTA